jgi:hypothetical protein
MFVAIIRVVFGLIAAALAAGAVQVAFVAGPDELLSPNLLATSSSRLQELGLLTLLAATQSAVFAAPFAFLAAAVTAWLPIRSGLFFVLAGIVIALAGFFAQYVGERGPHTILNRYALAAYVVSGLVAGFVYWVVAVPKTKPKPAQS